ncbi:MAG: hypothetical protein KKI02_09375 [Planctomycetes bacterium]|nr:hypothetical protein [Planctomycetota bacterium]
MSFTVVEPGAFSFTEPLGEGEVSISKNGTLTARAEDLALVGIGNYAIVLVDTGTLRLGLRSVRDGEQQKSVACSVITTGKDRHDSGRRRVTVTRAVKGLGLTIEAVCGRYTLKTHKDELVFIVLTEAKDIPQPQESSR